MKICSNCQRVNDDGVEYCEECGVKFEVVKPATDQGDLKFNDPMPASLKWRCWIGAWFLIALASLVMNPSSILATPFFPIGLLVWLPHGENKAIAGWMMGGWVIGWIFYSVFSITMLRVKKSGVFFIMFTIFFALLVLNVVGCQRVMQAASQIH